MTVRPLKEWTFEAIGTKWRIGVEDHISDTRLMELQQAVQDRIEAFDATYSRFRKDSLITAISKHAGTYELPDDSSRLFDYYHQLYTATDGLVTPLIGSTISEAGYDDTYSFEPGELHHPLSWDVLHLRGTTLTVEQPVLLDIGAAGKGYLVDILAEILVQHGVQRFMIDAGGDIRCHKLAEPLRIGLEHPTDQTQVIGVVNMEDGALCASAGNRRTWGNFTHILNPSTLSSPTGIVATWCLADEALHADGLATALFFSTPEHLGRTFQFEYCIAYSDGSLEYSEAFKAALFTTAETVNS